jgi:hypothetical protein
VHRALWDERDIAGLQFFLFLTDPLLDNTATQQDDFLLIGMAVEVMSLTRPDLDIEYDQIGGFWDVLRSNDPTEISPVEFFPFDVIYTDETHCTLLL